MTSALASASKLVVEIDIRNGGSFQQALKKHGLHSGKRQIDQHMSSDSLHQLRLALDKFGIPFEGIAQMKPWLVANMLIAIDLERHGYQCSDGIEYFLLSSAKEQTKAVQELESAEYQLSLYDGMTDAEQEQYLLQNLAQINNGSALKNAGADRRIGHCKRQGVRRLAAGVPQRKDEVLRILAPRAAGQTQPGDGGEDRGGAERSAYV